MLVQRLFTAWNEFFYYPATPRLVSGIFIFVYLLKLEHFYITKNCLLRTNVPVINGGFLSEADGAEYFA